jgi:hypothetical protein
MSENTEGNLKIDENTEEVEGGPEEGAIFTETPVAQASTNADLPAAAEEVSLNEDIPTEVPVAESSEEESPKVAGEIKVEEQVTETSPTSQEEIGNEEEDAWKDNEGEVEAPPNPSDVIPPVEPPIVDPEVSEIEMVAQQGADPGGPAKIDTESPSAEPAETPSDAPVDRLPKEPVKCGLPNQNPHLNLTEAREVAAARQPHMRDKDGNLVKIPLNTDLGQFAWPGQKKSKASEPLEDCGLGVVLYFKTLKSMGILFCIISAITMPPLVMFIASRTVTPTTAKFQLVGNSQVLLARVSKIINIMRCPHVLS